VLEVNGQRIVQALADNVALPPQPPRQPPLAALQPAPSAAPPAKAPVAPPVSQAPAAPPAAPKAQEKQGWDKDPVDLELEELARGIDLQFEDPAANEEKPGDKKQ
jgi:hypothetical protein